MPTLPMIHTYKSGPVEQVVMPGETVGIWINKVYQFYKVVFIDPPATPEPSVWVVSTILGILRLSEVIGKIVQPCTQHGAPASKK